MSQTLEDLERALQVGLDEAQKAAIAEIIEYAIAEAFEQQGRSQPWKPLSPRTIKQRRKRGTWPGNILVEYGNLFQGIQVRVEGSGQETKIVVRGDVPYLRIHQFGGFAGRGRKVKIPARPFVDLLDEDIDEIIDVLLK